MKTKTYQKRTKPPELFQNGREYHINRRKINPFSHIYMIASSPGIINLRSSGVEHHITVIKKQHIMYQALSLLYML